MTSNAASAGKSPWRSIWFRPQQAIKQVVQQRPRRSVLLLAMIGGMSFVFIQAVSLSGYDAISPAIVLLALMAGAIFGVISLYINGALLRLGGILLGGAASQQDLRAAMAWAQVPLALSLVIMLGILASRTFGWPSVSEPGDTIDLAVALGLIAAAILNLWALFLSIRTIGAVQSFGFFRSVLNFIFVIVLALILAFAVRIFAFQPFNIPAASMVPALIPGDYIFVKKFAYGYGRYSFLTDLGFSGRLLGAEPRRGDLVVFRLPRDPSIDYVKRLVGLPGDKIQMIGGVLHINGKAVERQRIEDYPLIEDGRERRVPRYRETLPDGVSYDTLDLIPNSEGDDTSVFTVPEGHYFMLGDNLDNSTDSRFSGGFGVGFVPRDNLIGRVSLLFFSKEEGAAGIRWDRVLKIPR